MAREVDLLVVDDEPVILQAAERILASGGLQCDLAPSGEVALEKTETQAYRAVLCDLILPGMGGYELVARLSDRLPGVPIILMTGYATIENAANGFSRGIFDFIPKPFDEAELQGVVRRALDFAEMTPRADPKGEVADHTSRVFDLGGHAWVAVESDGTARIGLGETFGAVIGDLEYLELPEVGELLLQGNRCVRWTTDDGLVHRLWTPLSGRVAEINARPIGDPETRSPDLIADSWVIRLMPSNLELELSKLVQR